MPEKKEEKPTEKDTTQDLAVKQTRLNRFYYDADDVEQLFNVQVKENVKKVTFFPKKRL